MARPTDRVWLAIGLSLVALTCFDVMGLIIKHLQPRFTTWELSAYRNLFGLIPSLIALYLAADWHRRGRKMLIRQWPLALGRGVLVTVAQFSFYAALGQISFATAATISYSNALFITALSVPILGERVGMIRWSAVLVGFAGVVLIIGPGSEGFSIFAVLPLVAAMLYALIAMTSRLIDDDVPSPLVNVYTQVSAAVCATTVTLSAGGFSQVSALGDALWLGAMGVVGGVAVLFLIASYRMTEPANLAPFSYFGIPLAFVLGWLIFGEAPWEDLFPGALLVAAGGLLIVWRERRIRARTVV